ncbi:GroES-like protein [Delitschia confertaspora ATCC 74209]|uniref:GroES-like protein n=1 Tax=Delitschia confertaspora ATCC 74209 TaxID=1513339 RepID=A0A9P4JK23_9PLEO|nr:GroES-like protein [Delitschia confertaspora ATCC 74209]
MVTMKRWEYDTASGGLEKNLHLTTNAPKPKITSKNQVLVEVISMAINPADYKVPEMGIISKAMISTPASPGMDFCGRVVSFGDAVKKFKEGELVFGALLGPATNGTLSQFVIVQDSNCASLPNNVSADHGAAFGAAGFTAYQSIAPHVKDGDDVFINGGSGGTGTWGIQIAKALGCHVTTSCSTGNVDLCKSLGADEVIDYKSFNIIEKLESKGQRFTLVVDNVGSPGNLYKASTSFLVPSGRFVQVGASMDFASAKIVIGNMVLPSFLGGGQRKYEFFTPKINADDLGKARDLLAKGKAKAVIDSTYEFENAPKAFEKLKTGRTKGKIVIHVKKE